MASNRQPPPAQLRPSLPADPLGEALARVLGPMLEPMIKRVMIETLAEVQAAEPPGRRLHDAREVGVAIDASRATVYRLVEEGLPYVLVGDTRKFDLDEVLAWLKARTAQARR
jgi:excisionase family DNA binding protein